MQQQQHQPHDAQTVQEEDGERRARECDVGERARGPRRVEPWPQKPPGCAIAPAGVRSNVDSSGLPKAQDELENHRGHVR